MQNPFTIRIFVPNGDPEGIRIIDRLSSTAKFFVCPREKWNEIKNREELEYAGVYILSGYANPDDDLSTLYVGQADTVKHRIENHIKNKDFWDKVIIFVSENKLNSTHAKWLEYSLVRQATKVNRCLLDNGNSPNEPTISEAEKAEMKIFLKELYETLPLVGIRSFEVPEVQTVNKDDKKKEKEVLDTIVVPAHKEGFKNVFMDENRWYAVRIAGGKLKEIKYVAVYQTSPISAVTHIAKVDKIIPYGDSGKYQLLFDGNAEKIKAIPFGEAKRGSMQSSRYVNHDKLINASNLGDLF